MGVATLPAGGFAAGAAALAGIAAGATLAWAALSPGSQLFGPTLVAPARPDEVALTYDDGPNPAATPALLEVLERHGVRASFFLIGGFVRQCPQLVREIHAAGHLIGNHTMTHPWLAWQSERRIREELRATSEAIEDLLGEPVRYFRPPHGSRRPVVLEVSREMGMTPVQWNLICGDWKPVGVDELFRRMEQGVRRNRRRGFATNVVLHDGGQLGLGAERMHTVRATERLLEHCLLEQKTETRFVTVDAWA